MMLIKRSGIIWCGQYFDCRNSRMFVNDFIVYSTICHKSRLLVTIPLMISYPNETFDHSKTIQKPGTKIRALRNTYVLFLRVFVPL